MFDDNTPEHDYMLHSASAPNFMDGMFPPLPDYIRKDIEAVLGVLSLPDSTSALAFNRLMAELHTCVESSKEHIRSSNTYKEELNSIDVMLESQDLDENSTVNGVKFLVERNAKAVKLMEDCLDLLCGKND